VAWYYDLFPQVTYPREKNWKMMIPGAELQNPKWDDTQSLQAITD
jgi:hypothetical protein